MNLVINYKNDLDFVDNGYKLNQEISDKLAIALLSKDSTDRLPQIINEITKESF